MFEVLVHLVEHRSRVAHVQGIALHCECGDGLAVRPRATVRV